MECSVCHKNLSKRLRRHYFDHPASAPEWFRVVLVDTRESEMLSNAGTLEEMYPALMWYEWNVPPVELVFFALPDIGRSPLNLTCPSRFIIWKAAVLPSACFGTFWTSLSNFWNYPLFWLKITDEGSVPEMPILSILLIKSALKSCIHLSWSPFLYL